MTFTVIPLEPHHLVDVLINSKQSSHKNILGSLPPNSWGAFYNGKLVGIGGRVWLDKGLGVWVLFTDEVNPKSFLMVDRALRQFIEQYKNHGLRLIMHANPEYVESSRWAKLLGFSLMGTEEIEGRVMQRFEQ